MKTMILVLVALSAALVWLLARSIGVQRELSRAKETVAVQEKQLTGLREDIETVASTLAAKNYAGGRISYVFTEIKPHTFVSGIHPNVVIGTNYVSDCADRFAHAYNAETTRAVQKERSQPGVGR